MSKQKITSKLTKRQKLQGWKHWRRFYPKHRTEPRIDTRRWNIKYFARVVNDLFKKADGPPLFPYAMRGERAFTMSRGVCMNYRNMTYEIQGHGSGVTKNKMCKKHEA